MGRKNNKGKQSQESKPVAPVEVAKSVEVEKPVTEVKSKPTENKKLTKAKKEKPEENPKIKDRKPFDPNTPTVFHLKERDANNRIERRITCVFTYDEASQTLKYGGAILRQTYDKRGHPVENWKELREKHIETAMGRFNKNPVTIKVFPTESPIKEKLVPEEGESKDDFTKRVYKCAMQVDGFPESKVQFYRRVRAQFKKHGVSGRHDANPESVNVEVNE